MSALVMLALVLLTLLAVAGALAAASIRILRE